MQKQKNAFVNTVYNVLAVKECWYNIRKFF